MATSLIRLDVTINDAAKTVIGKFQLGRGSPVALLSSIRDYVDQMIGGVTASSIRVATTAVQAVGAITFSSIANNDTVTINGTVFTAKTSGASGAVQFNIGGSDTAAALNLATAVNAHTTENKRVIASAAAAIITFTCATPGVIGNLMTLAISAHGSVSTAVAGGAEDTPVVVRHGL